MSKLILALILMMATYTSAQVTLTSANNPLPGNVESDIECDTNGITQGNAGPNQTWNYANVVQLDTFSFNWLLPNATPYGQQFPTSNIAAAFDTSVFSYYIASNSSLTLIGSATFAGIVPYSDPQTFIQYPFTYSSNFTDNFAANYTFSGITIYRTGTLTTSGDAWGTITLPSGSFNNALRVRSVVTSKDSSNIGGVPFVILTTSTSYAWYVPGKKFPVFGVSYASTSVNGMTQPTVKGVTYNPNSTSIGITQLGTGVANDFKLEQNYPNPFNPETKIKFDIPRSTFVKLTVYNALGREVEVIVNEQLQNGSYIADWNASDFTSGTYYYKLETEDFVETKKMILVK